ncbi:MAG: GNAT family protein [Pseudomonadota bacterium]
MGSSENLTVVLRAATRDDLDRIMALERRADMQAFIFESSCTTHMEALTNPDFSYLVIETDTPREPTWAGFCILSDLSSGSSKVTLKRLALEQAGQGVGTLAVKAIQRHVFKTLGKHRLALDCYADNGRAVRLYEKTGFQREGVLREASVKRDGRRMSLILFSMLKHEYDANHQDLT